MPPVWIEEQRDAKNCVSTGHWVGVVARHGADVWNKLMNHECGVLSQQNFDGTLVPSAPIDTTLQEASKSCVHPAQFISVACQRCGLHAVRNAVAFVTGEKQSHIIIESDEAESTAFLEHVVASKYFFS